MLTKLYLRYTDWVQVVVIYELKFYYCYIAWGYFDHQKSKFSQRDLRLKFSDWTWRMVIVRVHLFRLRSHVDKLIELNTEMPLYWYLDHGNTRICERTCSPFLLDTGRLLRQWGQANVQCQIHVFPWSKFQKESMSEFTSPSSSTWYLSQEKEAGSSLHSWYFPFY